MCTVGFDGVMPVTSFGWPGENASPSLQRRSEPSTSGDRASLNLEIDSYLLNAKLLLSDDFEELEVTSRLPIGPVRIFLTDSDIVIAKFTEDYPSKNLLSHLRTHAVEEIDIEVDPTEEGVMCLTVADGRRFLYRIKSGCESIASWMNRVFRLRRNTISPSSSLRSTMEERVDNQLPTLCCDRLLLPPLSIESHPSDSHDAHSDELTANGLDVLQKDDRLSLRKFSPLKRRKAFRNSDLDSFRSRTRSCSAPPDDNKPLSEITTSSNGSDIASIKNSAFESPTGARQSSLRKGKLKISPRAKRFTRALSARIIHSPLNDSTSEEKTVEVRRAKSLNHTAQSSTLPRSSKRNKNRSQQKFDPNTTPPPGTPTKPKSPGSILKIFNRKSGVSSYSLEEFMLSMEEHDLKSVDVHNKPKQLKLYLQPPKQLAEELSLIDAELFCNIQQAELQDGTWTKKNKHSTSPNILKMIDSFNQLSCIVCTEIVHEKTVSGRAKAITSYIQIASKLYKLHNYNSMKAVISGLQSQAVYRLDKSWSQVPSRRKKKFEKHSSFMSQMDSADQFAEFMEFNLRNNIQCIPFLGWLLTYTIHSQTFKKLQGKNESTHLPHHSTSVFCSSPRQSLRESMDNVSLPSSPLHMDSDKGSEMNSIVENFSAELLQFSKSLSDTCMQKYARGSSSTITPPSSHHDVVDFHFPDTETSYDFLHPLTSKSTCFINPVAFSRLQHDQQSRSSSSSIEESVQTDSAIGLDSSTGQPSPAHRSQNGYVKSLKQKTIQFDHSSQMKLQFTSMPSFSDYFDNADGCLQDIVHICKSQDEEIDSEGRPDRGLGSSFTGASLSSFQSPIISPSMISISLISEPSTPQKTVRQSGLFNTRQHCQYGSANSLNCPEDSTLSLLSCGVLFTTSTTPINLLYSQGLVSFEDIKRQVQDFFSFTNSDIDSERNTLENFVKFSTPVKPVLNISATSALSGSQGDISTSEINETAYQDSLSQTSCSKKNESAENCVNDSVLVQHQMNTLNYSCELTSRQHMRCLINTVPWLDENQCYKVSMDVEPSS